MTIHPDEFCRRCNARRAVYEDRREGCVLWRCCECHGVVEQEVGEGEEIEEEVTPEPKNPRGVGYN